jgi:hypothetical protein
MVLRHSTLCVLLSDVTVPCATAGRSASGSSFQFNAYCLLDATNRYDIQQDRQCACNTTFRRMCATTVAVEKQYTHSECVLVALGLQHAVPMSHTFICGLSGSTAFPYIISETALCSKNKLLNIKCAFLYCKEFCEIWSQICRSQWQHGLRRRSAASCMLRSWVRIPPGAWRFVVSVVFCQVEFSVTSWSLVQRSPTGCGASMCVI